MKRQFHIEAEVIHTYEGFVEANSPEEAETIVEDMLANGEIEDLATKNAELIGFFAQEEAGAE